MNTQQETFPKKRRIEIEKRDHSPTKNSSFESFSLNCISQPTVLLQLHREDSRTGNEADVKEKTNTSRRNSELNSKEEKISIYFGNRYVFENRIVSFLPPLFFHSFLPSPYFHHPMVVIAFFVVDLVFPSLFEFCREKFSNFIFILVLVLIIITTMMMSDLGPSGNC